MWSKVNDWLADVDGKTTAQKETIADTPPK